MISLLARSSEMLVMCSLHIFSINLSKIMRWSLGSWRGGGGGGGLIVGAHS